jgi:hypothetical protein
MNTQANTLAGNPTELVDRYIAMWNETDGARRRALIARTWTSNANYLDPLLQGSGHDGIDAMVAAVHERYPGHRFTRTSEVDMHHDRVRFDWTLGPKDGPALVQGTDFGVVTADQLLSAVTGFFNQSAAERGAAS